MNTDLLISFTIAIVAIVNPIGKVPVWLDAVRGESRSASRRLGLLVTATGCGILVAAMLAGRSALDLFGLDIPSFRVGGGVIILIIAIQMVQGRITDVDPDDSDDAAPPMQEAKQRFNQVVVPLAVPILAGPGSITTAIVYSSRAESWTQRLAMAGVILALFLVIYATFMAAPYVRRVLGRPGLTIVTRLFGLVLAGIAVETMAKGLAELFPAWLTPESPLAESSSGAGTSAGTTP